MVDYKRLFQGAPQSYNLGHPITAEALKDLREDKERLKEEKFGLQEDLKQMREMSDMFAHELISPLITLSGFAKRLGKIVPPSEKVTTFLEYINSSARRLEGLPGILYLQNPSKINPERDFELVDLPKIARDFAEATNHTREKNKLNLKLRYDTSSNIYTHPLIIKTIWETLSGNQLNYSPQLTTFKQAIRNNKEENCVQIFMENLHNGTIQRQAEGLGKGLGLRFLEEYLPGIGGSIRIYNGESRIIKPYPEYRPIKSFPPEKKADTSQLQLFGVEVRLSLEELAKS